MDLAELAPVTRMSAMGLRRMRSVPRQLVEPGSSDLSGPILRRLEALVRPALTQSTEEAFVQYLHDHVEQFQILVLALSIGPSDAMNTLPHAPIDQMLVEVLGPGADAEFDFAESTLWAALRRAERLGHRPVTPVSMAEDDKLASDFAGPLFGGLFAWCCLTLVTERYVSPVAVRMALVVLRKAALDANRLVTLASELRNVEELDFSSDAFDAEDMALALDPAS